MHKVLHRKPDPRTVTAPAEYKHLHYFPLCHIRTHKAQNPGLFSLPLCPFKSPGPGQPCVLLFSALSYHQSMKWKGDWMERQKPEF